MGPFLGDLPPLGAGYPGDRVPGIKLADLSRICALSFDPP